MKKLLTGIFLTAGLIVFLAVSFIFYAQFALDYSLENLQETLEASQEKSQTGLGNHIYEDSLNALIVDEISQKHADLEHVVLLEHAASSLRSAVQQSGYNQAGVYIAEVLKDKSPKRNILLRMIDSVYRFFRNMGRSFQGLWKYVMRRVGPARNRQPLEQTGVLILSEAEKMEKGWKLGEAERYYREFLDRFSDRPERGFVKIALAQVLTKMRRLKEATLLAEEIQKEFPGGREETLAVGIKERITAVQKRLNRLPELENWIKSVPDRFFSEEGGLELALSYLATYQLDQALKVLEKLSAAPDPRLRAKAIFYQGWVHKWQGDLDQGKAFFQMLEKEPHVEEGLEMAATAEIAQVHFEKKEYKQALDIYEKLSRKAAGEAWSALSELEQGSISLFGIGDTATARKQLEKLETLFPRGSPEFEAARKRFEAILERGLKDEGFGALVQGRVEVALQNFQDYVKKYPRDGTAHSGLASIYLIRGSLKEALREAKKGFSLERTEYTATVMGYVYEKMEKYKEAIEYYNIALQIDPFYLTARFNLGWVYVMAGRFKEADQILTELEKEISKLSPVTQAKVLNNRGCALWGLGQKEQALERFKEALRMLPDFIEAKNNINLAVGQKPVPAVI